MYEAGIWVVPESSWKSVVLTNVFHGVPLFWTKIKVPSSWVVTFSCSKENSNGGNRIVSLGMNR